MEELQQSQRERDEAVLLQTSLERSIQELEATSHSSAQAKEEKARLLKLMEVGPPGPAGRAGRCGALRGSRTEDHGGPRRKRVLSVPLR